jgi:hypothetical protein
MHRSHLPRTECHQIKNTSRSRHVSLLVLQVGGWGMRLTTSSLLKT